MHSVEWPCSVIPCPLEGFAGKTLVGKSDFLHLALGLDEVVRFETAKSRGDRVARKSDAIQDVEAKGMSSTVGSEKEARVVGQFRVRHDYVGI